MASVLVVDDEPAIVELLTVVLQLNGCACLSASSGVEALLLFSSYRSKIDLVLTDVVMPGMNGVELVERIRAVDPTVPIIFMSGSVPENIKIPDGLPLIKKPFPPQALIQLVEQMLSSCSHGPSGSG